MSVESSYVFSVAVSERQDTFVTEYIFVLSVVFTDHGEFDAFKAEGEEGFPSGLKILSRLERAYKEQISEFFAERMFFKRGLPESGNTLRNDAGPGRERREKTAYLFCGLARYGNY